MRRIALFVFTMFFSCNSLAERFNGFDVIGNFSFWKTREAVEAILNEGMQDDSQRYQLVQVGCGTECLSYLGVVDFRGFKVYLFDEPVDAFRYPEGQNTPEMVEPDFVFDYEVLMVQGRQMIFSLDAGPLKVVAQNPLQGREIQSTRAYADQFTQNPSAEDYVGVIVGCGTQCMVLSAVIRVRDWVVLDLDENIDAIEALENPKFLDFDGKKFIFDGELLRERK